MQKVYGKDAELTYLLTYFTVTHRLGAVGEVRMRALIVKTVTNLAETFTSRLPSEFHHIAYAFPEEPWVGLMQAHTYDLVVLHFTHECVNEAELLRPLKGKKPASPILVVSGAPFVPCPTKPMGYGVHSWLTPEVTATDLLKKLTLLYPWGTFNTRLVA
jgi:DNA-binding NtrC family response regulator